MVMVTSDLNVQVNLLYYVAQPIRQPNMWSESLGTSKTLGRFLNSATKKMLASLFDPPLPSLLAF